MWCDKRHYFGLADCCEDHADCTFVLKVFGKLIIFWVIFPLWLRKFIVDTLKEFK